MPLSPRTPYDQAVHRVRNHYMNLVSGVYFIIEIIEAAGFSVTASDTWRLRVNDMAPQCLALLEKPFPSEECRTTAFIELYAAVEEQMVRDIISAATIEGVAPAVLDQVRAHLVRVTTNYHQEIDALILVLVHSPMQPIA